MPACVIYASSTVLYKRHQFIKQK